MRKVIYAVNTSLDGYIEDRNGSLDWGVPAEELHRYFNDLELTLDTHLYGRRLWETMTYWLTAEADSSLPEFEREFAARWNANKHIVVSTTLKDADGVRIISDNLAEEVRALKQETGENIGVGGAALAQSLLGLGLVDEIMCFVWPVLLGGGKRMFGDMGATEHLRLVEVRHFNGGVVLLHYRKHD